MAALFLDRGIDPLKVQSRLEKVAAEVDLPFGKREKTYNSRLAQELGKWAEHKGKGDVFHDTLFRACLVDGKNISAVHVLTGLAEKIGLPADEAERVLETGTFKEAVDRDWLRSKRLGITVVPTMAVNETKLIGAQQYKKMEQFLIENNVKKRDLKE